MPGSVGWMVMLSVSEVSCRPPDGAALHDVSFRVEAGRCVALVGPNGSGKSTICRCIAGAIHPATGAITLDAVPLAGTTWERARRGIVVIPKGSRTFPELSVVDHLWMVATPDDGATRRDRVEASLQRFPALRAVEHQRAGVLSGGEQQLLAIALAWSMGSRGRLLVLEEPSFGLSPRATTEVYGLLRDVAREGRAILTTEESPGFVRGWADEVVLLDRGRVRASGPPAAALREDLVQEVFFGVISGVPRDTASP